MLVAAVLLLSSPKFPVGAGPFHVPVLPVLACSMPLAFIHAGMHMKICKQFKLH